MRRMIIGCGYLGRRVARKWLAAGDSVLALTRSRQHASTLRELGIEPRIGDVTQPDSLAALPECDTVLHAVGFDRKALASRRDVSVEGLRSVLDAVAGRCQQLLHVSSTSVYGQENGERVDETSPCNPSHEAGRICLEAEQLVAERTGPGCVPETVILRLSGIYGPQRLLARIEALRNSLPLPGNPDAWLNLIHVDDAAQAVVLAADQPASPEPHAPAPLLLLVSDNQPVRRRAYYETLARLLHVNEVRFDARAPARHSRGLGKRCDNRRLRNDLGITLQYPTMESGLPEAISS